MNAVIKCASPKTIEYSLTITASVEEFIELSNQLDEKWPSSKLSMKIASLVRQANQTYWPEQGSADE